MEVLLSIDPGKDGGLAWRTPSGSIEAKPLPKIPHELVELIVKINPAEAIIEKVGGFIGEEEKSNGHRMFNFGYIAGAPYWTLLTLGKRVRFVTPQKWQKALSLGRRSQYGNKWKNHLKTIASDLFPSITVSLKTADALLMLEAVIKQKI